jgi:signal transduction histidine kinase
VEQVRSGLTDEVSLLRRMMSELRPPVLDERGLGAAISDYARGWGQREDFPTELSTEIAIFPAAPQIEIIVYRLVQEALRNVARHARADHVTVVLRTLGPAELELIVADDGVGFDVRRAGDFVRHGHFGLAGMRERVQAARGTFDVVSAPGEGTRIRALLPTSESLLRR